MEHEHPTLRARTQVRRPSTRWICRQIRLLAGLDPDAPVTRRPVDHAAIDRALERVERRDRASG